MKRKTLKRYILSTAIFLVFILTSCCPKIETNTETTKILKEIRQDTIRIITNPTIEYVGDTIIQTKPFIFRIDTILKTIYQNRVKIDTIKINYSFPTNDYQMTVKSSQDSIFTEIKKEIQTIQSKSFIERFFDQYIYWLIGLIGIILITYIIIIKK